MKLISVVLEQFGQVALIVLATNGVWQKEHSISKPSVSRVFIKVSFIPYSVASLISSKKLDILLPPFNNIKLIPQISAHSYYTKESTKIQKGIVNAKTLQSYS